MKLTASLVNGIFFYNSSLLVTFSQDQGEVGWL